MKYKISERAVVFLVLGILVISAFFVRLNNFKNSHGRSIDEIVYYRLASQISKDIKDYHSIPYAKELTAEGRPLPPYFFQPLFKHPPLYSLLAALSIKIFGDTIQASFYVALLFGVLLIPLVYYLGTAVYDKRTGMLAAIFLWLDPVSVICSQKVWLETTMTFFIFLSIAFYFLAIREKKDAFFVFCGISIGLATVTKYPGILALAVVLAHAGTYRRELFKNIYFFATLIMPFIMLLPWMAWNYKIYGHNFLAIQQLLHEHVFRIFKTYWHSSNPLWLAFISIVASLFVWRNIRSQEKPQKKIFLEGTKSRVVKNILWGVGGLLFTIVLHKELLHSLRFNFVPDAAWSDIFAGSPPTFYFARLLEFSLIYVFAFAAFFMYKTNSEESLVRIAPLVIFTFFILWGNYQSRYVLPAIPFLLILASQVLLKLVDAVYAIRDKLLRSGGKIFLMIIVLLIFVRLFYVDFALSFPNDMCYF